MLCSWWSGSAPKICARHTRACRLRESSCSRLIPSETVAHAARRHAGGPSWLGWVPSGSRLGRAEPAGPALYAFNYHVRYTHETSLRVRPYASSAPFPPSRAAASSHGCFECFREPLFIIAQHHNKHPAPESRVLTQVLLPKRASEIRVPCASLADRSRALATHVHPSSDPHVLIHQGLEPWLHLHHQWWC